MFSQTLLEVLKDRFLEKKISVSYDGKQALSIIYNDQSRSYVEKLIGDFSKSEDYNLLLLKQSEVCNFTIQMKKDEKPISELFDFVLESFEHHEEDKNYYDLLGNMDKGMCDVFQQALNFSGNFGIGSRTINDTKKFTIKTDIPDLISAMEKAGFPTNDDRVIIRENGSEVPVEVTFQQIVQNLHVQNKKEEAESLSSNEDLSQDSSKLIAPNVDTEVLSEEEVEVLEKVGPKMTKSLGTMPSSSRGISSWFGLFFFLLLDIVAIGLGIYLLMH